MADQDCSTSGGSSEAKVELKVKTLDSKIHTFCVDKNMTVLSFKKEIVAETGVPAEQQRLIFKGKVLKNEDHLSSYNVENGDALHLVVRQIPQPESHPGNNSGAANGSNSNQENNTAGGGLRNRVGQISHSVMLGTLNVGDHGEGMVPDIGRVIGSVLNSIGIGGNISIANDGMQPNVQVNVSSQTSNEGDGTHTDQHQARSQNGSRDVPPFSFPQGQIPLVGSFIPSIYQPMPHSLTTLFEYIDRMNSSFTDNGYRPRLNSMPGEFVLNNQGPPTHADLHGVLHHTERLLLDRAIQAISRLQGRLAQVGTETDAIVRGQIQNESMEMGLAMHHLGILFLELGRTMQTLHVGQSPAELFINAGPALYLSSSGPNPIMVQSSALQPSPMLSAPGFQLMSQGLFGPTAPASSGSGTRHVNIHIRAGEPFPATVVSRANNNGGQNVARASGTGSSVAGQSCAPVAATSIPNSSVVPTDRQTGKSDGLEPGSTGDILSAPSSEEHADTVNSSNEEIVVSITSDSGQPDAVSLSASRQQPEQPSDTSNLEQPVGLPTAAVPVSTPLGLGPGGLHPRRPNTQSRSQGGDEDNSTSNISQIQRGGQEILRVLASRILPQSGPDSAPPGASGVANVMSQVIHSPAVDSLLAGVSEQAGVGSPDVLRNMLQQLTQSPQMQNAFSQIAEQVGSRGSIGTEGGRVDIPSMLQQVLPVVSRALGRSPFSDQVSDHADTEVEKVYVEQHVEELARALEQPQEPGEIFRGVIEAALECPGNENAEGVVELLCSHDSLAQEYMEVLFQDIGRRVHRDAESS